MENKRLTNQELDDVISRVDKLIGFCDVSFKGIMEQCNTIGDIIKLEKDKYGN